MKADYGFTPDRIRPRNVLPALVFLPLFAVHLVVAPSLVLASAVMTIVLAVLARRRRFAVGPIMLASLRATLSGYAAAALMLALADLQFGPLAWIRGTAWRIVYLFAFGFVPATSFFLCAIAATIALRLGWGRPLPDRPAPRPAESADEE
ncbi:hypothetical protein JD292_09095 [Leucobacter sp. CSA2]|uniref:Uncharacterized protein n=1 Tax=Leucobacter edaphi TaxID=2796472 RepID=A0A934QEU0_9MICO|nr:hypothetical protein [Leucobacter edaphi]MBK0422229.1 hypothetical protein [Leucobacter edaphi]